MNNNCVVLPTELPGVVVVTATGRENLLVLVLDVRQRHRRRRTRRLALPDADLRLGSRVACWRRTPPRQATWRSRRHSGGWSVDPNGNYYAWLNGTSMAAPHAAGVAALIRAAHPAMPQGAVAALLRNSATTMPCPTALDPGVVFFAAPVQVCSGGIGSNNFYGAGLVNALAAASS